jgi:hypothetical protein
MSEEDRQAWEAGRWGGAPPSGGSEFDAWQRGNATRNWNPNPSPSTPSSSTPFTPFTPTLPSYPTAPTAPMGDAPHSGSETWTPTGNTGAGRGALGCLFVLALLFFGGPLFNLASGRWVGVLPLWVALYPGNSLSTVASGIGAYMLLQQKAPTPGPINTNALLWALPVALVAFVVTSRLEHTLARGAAYRTFRHIVRLGIFGLGAQILVLQSSGQNLFPRRRPPDFARLWHGLSDPVGIGVTVAVVVGMHFLLWTDNPLRRFWHGALEALRLRPRN